MPQAHDASPKHLEQYNATKTMFEGTLIKSMAFLESCPNTVNISNTQGTNPYLARIINAQQRANEALENMMRR